MNPNHFLFETIRNIFTNKLNLVGTTSLSKLSTANNYSLKKQPHIHMNTNYFSLALSISLFLSLCHQTFSEIYIGNVYILRVGYSRLGIVQNSSKSNNQDYYDVISTNLRVLWFANVASQSQCHNQNVANKFGLI